MQRHLWKLALAAGMLWAGWSDLRAADEPDEVVKKQKATAEANWKRTFDKEPFVHLETSSLLIYSAKSFTEGKLQSLGKTLDDQYALARKPLGLDPKKPLWPGKLTVYCYDDRQQFASFVRGVEKRRLERGELGSFLVKKEQSHIAVCTPKAKDDPSLESQAGEQLASALLAGSAGENNGLPDWLIAGFGQATAWRADKKQRDATLKKMSKKPLRSARELWDGSLSGEEMAFIRASVVDYLAFGPAADKFPQLVKAFKPEEGQESKPLDEVLKSVNWTQESLDKDWMVWVRKGSK